MSDSKRATKNEWEKFLRKVTSLPDMSLTPRLTPLSPRPKAPIDWFIAALWCAGVAICIAVWWKPVWALVAWLTR